MAADWYEIPPPANMTVPVDRKVVLITPDGKQMVRLIGFTVQPETGKRGC